MKPRHRPAYDRCQADDRAEINSRRFYRTTSACAEIVVSSTALVETIASTRYVCPRMMARLSRPGWLVT